MRIATQNAAKSMKANTDLMSVQNYLAKLSPTNVSSFLYKITKEKDYLTFTSKKPYNHLYRTKTMEITYANSGEYVIVTDHQAYRIPKESVSESR